MASSYHISGDLGQRDEPQNVQRIVREARDADKSVTRKTDPIYGEFEKLALNYLAKEGESCKDLDNQ